MVSNLSIQTQLLIYLDIIAISLSYLCDFLMRTTKKSYRQQKLKQPVKVAASQEFDCHMCNIVILSYRNTKLLFSTNSYIDMFSKKCKSS